MGPPSLNGGNSTRPRSPPTRPNLWASMGPPSLNGGNAGPDQDLVASGDLASMGPPSLNGGNWQGSRRGGWRTGRLQWGRRLSTAEISAKRTISDHLRGASMGPPSLNGGNWCALRGVRAKGTLQWGRRLSTAEIRAYCLDCGADGPLQWGRRLSTAEIEQDGRT